MTHCNNKSRHSAKMKIMILAAATLVSIYANAQSLPILKVNIQNAKDISDDYQQGNMQLTDVNGDVIELNAKFKKRGATAKEYSMKPAFNMKLRNEDYTAEQDSTLLGMRSSSSWILDAMAIDRVCMRNRVCFDIWNELSQLPYTTQFQSRNGTIGRFVEVYINNSYYGIYCLTDRINRKLLNLKKPKVETDGTVTPRGIIYKQGTNDIADQNTAGFYNGYSVYVIQEKDAWELVEPEDYPSETVWQPLIDAYRNYDSYEQVKRKFYLNNLAEYQILVMALSIEDNWGNKNIFFSLVNMQKDDDDSRIIITPWDMDTSLGGDYKGTYFGENLKTDWPIDGTIKKGKQPFATCLAHAEYNQLLHDTWVKARKGALSIDNVTKHLHNYRDLFINSGAWKRQWDYFQTQKYKPQMVENLEDEIDHIVRWYTERYKAMDEFFNIATGIHDIADGISENAVYDLQGRRLTEGYLQKGIYIKNGRKYAVGSK